MSSGSFPDIMYSSSSTTLACSMCLSRISILLPILDAVFFATVSVFPSEFPLAIDSTKRTRESSNASRGSLLCSHSLVFIGNTFIRGGMVLLSLS